MSKWGVGEFNYTIGGSPAVIYCKEDGYLWGRVRRTPVRWCEKTGKAFGACIDIEYDLAPPPRYVHVWIGNDHQKPTTKVFFKPACTSANFIIRQDSPDSEPMIVGWRRSAFDEWQET